MLLVPTKDWLVCSSCSFTASHAGHGLQEEDPQLSNLRCQVKKNAKDYNIRAGKRWVRKEER